MWFGVCGGGCKNEVDDINRDGDAGIAGACDASEDGDKNDCGAGCEDDAADDVSRSVNVNTKKLISIV